jgi:hypothetical protein
LQVWEYTDTDHRLTPGVLARIFEKAAPIFGGEDYPIEVEFEQCVISQYPVKSGAVEDGKLVFTLETKHTACLAMERCGLAPGEEGEGSGCCGGGDCDEEEKAEPAEAASCCSPKAGCCS